MTSPASTGRRSGVSLDQVAEAALECFMDAGYRLTQIADVAARLRISVGAIYRYVDGKETLFHVAALRAAGMVETPAKLPLEASAALDTGARLRVVIAHNARWPALQAAVVAPAVVEGDIVGIGAELYDLLATWAPLIVLMERCVRDRPDIAALFEAEMRGRYMGDLTAWARRFERPGLARADTLARGAMEAVSWLALRRPRDQTGRAIADDEARAAGVELFTSAFRGRLDPT